jgi:hypothetical protein
MDSFSNNKVHVNIFYWPFNFHFLNTVGSPGPGLGVMWSLATNFTGRIFFDAFVLVIYLAKIDL